ncbi:hypothetical protein [Rubrivivax gelatinosus]|nr:hypothetical protein [Rubrivivax gelatinosus]
MAQIPHRVVGAWQAVREFDERRASLPGEHLATLGAGLVLLRQAPRTSSTLARVLVLAAGTALLWRAASGRDGLRRFKRGAVQRGGEPDPSA